MLILREGLDIYWNNFKLTYEYDDNLAQKWHSCTGILLKLQNNPSLSFQKKVFCKIYTPCAPELLTFSTAVGKLKFLNCSMETPSLRLSEIRIYPVKSLAGIQLQEAQLTERGLRWDRRWMLLDENGQFMTQRQIAAMALLKVSLQAEHLEVQHAVKDLPVLKIPLQPDPSAEQVQAPIWEDSSKALLVSREADEWFSQALGQSCRLVFMPDDGERITIGKTSGMTQKVSFADEYPLLMIGQSSLDELNRRLKEPVPMDRFRPNLVFSGGVPFEEDGWHAFSIGKTSFRAEKPCARCVVTTIDQQTGRKLSKEPLATLAGFRKWNQKILFGQNVMFEKEGILKVGDFIKINSHKEAPLPL